MIDPGAGPEAFQTAIDNRARNLQILTPGNNRLMQRLALPLVALSKMNAQHPGPKLFFHGLSLVCVDLRRAMGILDDVNL